MLRIHYLLIIEKGGGYGGVDRLREIGLEGFALVDNYYGPASRQRQPTVATHYYPTARVGWGGRWGGAGGNIRFIPRETVEEKRARVQREAADKERQDKVEKVEKERRDSEEEETRVREERGAEEEINVRAKREAAEKEQRDREEAVIRRVRKEREAEEEISFTGERGAEEGQFMVEREVEEGEQDRAKREEEEERRASEKRKEEIKNGETLYKAICGNNWASAKEFLEKKPNVLTTKVTSSGKTALHVAAMFGHVSIVEEIVRLVSSESLETTDDFGNTPLLIATVTGITTVAKCLVSKNANVLGIPNSTDELPVTLAFLNGHQEMGRYLYDKTPLEYLHPEKAPLRGALLVHYCLQTQCFGT